MDVLERTVVGKENDGIDVSCWGEPPGCRNRSAARSCAEGSREREDCRPPSPVGSSCPPGRGREMVGKS